MADRACLKRPSTGTSGWYKGPRRPASRWTLFPITIPRRVVKLFTRARGETRKSAYDDVAAISAGIKEQLAARWMLRRGEEEL